MDTKKLDKWAELLLDTGKRNNLMNFRETKATTAEALLPDAEELLRLLDTALGLEVYDPASVKTGQTRQNEEAAEAVQTEAAAEVPIMLTETPGDETVESDNAGNGKENLADGTESEQEKFDKTADPERSRYLAEHGKRLKRRNQILLYNKAAKVAGPAAIVHNIDKKAKGILEETGINVAYMAFGFIHWKESKESAITFQAPVLLIPVSFRRESAAKPYFIKATEGEAVTNAAFSYLMNAQYGITIPEYEEESLTEYLSKVAQLVKGLGWTVSTECRLGLFSFQKINMYRDLKENADRILQNPNVRMLMGESAEAGDGLGLNADEEKRPENPLVELCSVVDADSSQIEAIEMARSGRSYVLQGPPGTGKSQTITNIIAECLSEDKKVLFVSEKLAALNVVYDKLKKAGLSDFCLELHSYKANKREVISELCRVLKADKSGVNPKAKEEIEIKKRAQHQLDSYEAELHKERPVIEKSLYQLYEAAAHLTAVPRVKWAIPMLQEKGETYRKETSELLLQYEEYIPSIGYDYRRNPWYGYCNPDGSYQARLEVQQDLSVIRPVLFRLQEITAEISNRYAIECLSIEDARFWQKAFRYLSDSGLVTPQLLKAEVFNLVDPSLSELRELGTGIREMKEQLDAEYDEDLYDIDGSACHRLLMRQFNTVGSRLLSAEYRNLMKQLRLVRKDGRKLSYEDAVELTERLAVYARKVSEFEEKEREILPYLGKDYQGLVSDWDAIKSQMDGLYELLEERRSFGGLTRLQDLSQEGAAFAEYSSRLEQALSGCEKDVLERCESYYDPQILSMQNSNVSLVLNRVTGCLVQLEEMENADPELSREGDAADYYGAADEPAALSDAAAQGNGNGHDAAEGNAQPRVQLEQWLRFRGLLHRMEEEELLPYINQAIAQNIRADQFERAFRRLFYEQWIDAVIRESEVLAGFRRTTQDRAVRVFCEKDKEQFEINKAVIRARLSAKRPDLSMTVPGSSVALLRREGEKKRRQKSIRNLLSEAGELVQTLKPCFLMSPLSVSTFLQSDEVHFDVVIFDEASQIFPQDAIGAIYRADQMIVVGDSRQMPPSNFFQSILESEEDDEEAGDAADYESILDMCTANLPSLRLKWHYRSRSERLIAFSNHYFYENELVTFRAAREAAEGVGVSYYYAGGNFDRKTHTNRAEAELIVGKIYEELERHPKRSLGVVAFSAAQQELIDRLLEKQRASNPQKEYLFTKNEREPLFIKNLETAQGDERDTILLSVAYGPGSDGRLLYNFGPLNRIGGERRLNVAVTRARCSIQVVSSMHAADIDLTRTTSEGARLLRNYLDYAEHEGPNAEEAIQANNADGSGAAGGTGTAGEVWDRELSVQAYDTFDSEFEMEVCGFLRSRGFTVDTQVGCSGYRIDLGVRLPNTSDYVLAVECDGASYHFGKNARDRDRIRQERLENLGWTFYRVWSTDWFRNSYEERRLLLEAAADAVGRAEHAGKIAADAEAGTGIRNSDEASVTSGNGASGTSAGSANSAETAAGAAGAEPGIQNEPQQNEYEEKLKGQNVIFPPYRAADIENMRHYRYEGNLQVLVKAILEVEAPVWEESLLKRILWWFDKEKLTSTVLTEYNRQMYGCHRYGITRDKGFLYLDRNGRKPQLRVGGDIQRDLHMVAPEELAAGMLTIIEQNVTVDKGGMYHMLAGLFGVTRVGAKVELQMDNALKLIENRLEIHGEMISMKDTEE